MHFYKYKNYKNQVNYYEVRLFFSFFVFCLSFLPSTDQLQLKFYLTGNEFLVMWTMHIIPLGEKIMY